MKNLLDFARRRPLLAGALALAALTILVYGDTLFWPRHRVISRPGADLELGIFGLEFLSHEWRSGNFVLWCPYLLSGYPIFAGFQSLQLYPFSLVFLLLPVGPAVNLFILLHVWLMGFGMHWWMLRRGLHPLASTMAGALLMLGSTTTMQIYGGHITPLAAMTWTPFLFVALDGLLDDDGPRWKWVLAGTLFVALQIAGCFPQHLVYSAMAAGLYFLVRLGAALRFRGWSWRRGAAALAGAGTIYLWGALLLMAQLLMAWHASKETSRAVALPYSFVSTYSFPPENFLTLLAPTFFGDEVRLTYWGRWSFEEMTFFFGITALLLAVWGLWKSQCRARWLWLGLCILMTLIALGRYAPVQFFLYQHVPLFGSFRASSRALFQSSIFLCALAGLGLDQLLRAELSPSQSRARLRFAAPLIVAFAAFLSALWLGSNASAPLWNRWLAMLGASRQTYVFPHYYVDAAQTAVMAQNGAQGLLLAAIVATIAVLLFRAGSRSRRGVYWLAGFALLEIAVFARGVRRDFDLRAKSQPALQQFFAAHPGDYRFIKNDLSNLPLRWRVGFIGGYESFRLRRYDEFINWTQGRKPDEMEPVLSAEKYHRLYEMLRCRYVFAKGATQPTSVHPILPHVLLAGNYEVRAGRDAVFRALGQSSFDPRQTVILETEPKPKPAGAQGTVKIVDSSTDHLTIEADVPRATLLLITDSYSRDWVATALAGSVQQEYSLLPANYVLRAIPLQAGRHRLRVEYAPPILGTGKIISLAALLAYLAAIGVWIVRTRKGATR